MSNKVDREQGAPVLSEWDETSESKDFTPSVITFIPGPDGIPTPSMPPVALKPPQEATEETVRCLHGPCDSYAERRHSYACAGGVTKTRVQRFCKILGDALEPADTTDLELTVCSAHRIDGVDQGDADEIKAILEDNFCRGCKHHVEIVFPSQVIDEDDDLADFCVLLDGSKERNFVVETCQFHTAPEGARKDV